MLGPGLSHLSCCCSCQLTCSRAPHLCCLLPFSLYVFLCFIKLQSSLMVHKKHHPGLCPFLPPWDSSSDCWKAICVFLPNCFLAGDSRVRWFPLGSSRVFSSSFSCPFSVITQFEKHLHPIRSSFGYIKLNTKGEKMFDGRVTLSSRKQSGDQHRVPGVSKLKNRLDPYF